MRTWPNPMTNTANIILMCGCYKASFMIMSIMLMMTRYCTSIFVSMQKCKIYRIFDKDEANNTPEYKVRPEAKNSTLVLYFFSTSYNSLILQNKIFISNF